MDPVSLIEAALVAGAAASTQDIASQSVKDAYAGLKSLLSRLFENKPRAKVIIDEHEIDPETYEKPLKKLLIEAHADRNDALLRQAQQVLKLVNPQQASQGKYNVQIGEGKGIVIGDHTHVDQHFGKE